MRLVLIGSGQMGMAVQRLARERGHEIAAVFNRDSPITDALSELAADVAIDFSLPSAAPVNIEECARRGLPVVVGTTGWYDSLPRIRPVVDSLGGSLLYSPNFSLGIALLTAAIRGLLPILDRLPDLDVNIHETHHVRKVDSPSGTALHLAGVITGGLERKSRIQAEAIHGKIAGDTIHVTSTRAGSVVGVHEIEVDGPHDHLTLSHQAKSRAGFALGALIAAEWLPGRTGVFTLEDMLDDWIAAGVARPTLVT